ncbi:hypothetical protein FD723_10475 [Nostoc sp. C052]|uniref:RAMP superfamily CRISPR-associated protein n=1 Tax=Nostoc sp. C052 TaxID=2576902 RepID=UPI0015C31371|nr:RAMP superfamily CRISPR-associated protein [Nostoc sp. C052]QLE40844.1 hypothetical protein FD723_10475 [Nostoc sp. C052]
MGRLTVKMLSDWHIGSGTGVPGSIDRTVRRDSQEFPFIPAKTLTGIWRDACERVVLGLDEGNGDGYWHRWVDYLFGDQPALTKAREIPPQQAALSVRPAHLSDTLRTALQNKPKLKQALTFIKPGISIDPQSGCAKPEYLRFEELVRVGTILEAEYSLPPDLKIDSDEYKTAQALLAAGAAMVERLGAKRRRGFGRCQMSLDLKLEDALQWLEKNQQKQLEPPKIKNGTGKSSDTVMGKQPTDAENWYQLELEIIPKLPLLLYKRTVGNVVETLDYIPGTNLLPIIHRHLEQLGINVGEAIANGRIIVTHATLVIDGTPAKPVPLALFTEKLNKQNVYNRLVTSQEGKSQLKGYRSGYVGENTNQLTIATVDLVVETHNTVDDGVQRPTSEVGGVYSYEAIASGTRMMAQLRLCLHEDLLKTFQDNWWVNLNGTYHIGRSSKDDYGLVSLEVKSEPTKILQQPKLNQNFLTVWLLSDVLLRNKRLRPTTNIDDFTQVLEQEIGVKLTLRKQSDLISHLVRSRRTESWQTNWQLPRPSLLGLQAGTCIIYQVDVNPDLDKLMKLEIKGIGERRVEGYGQLCFNHQLLSKSSFTLSTLNQNDLLTNFQPISISDTPVFEYAIAIEKAAWRETIYQAVIAKAADKSWRKQVLGIEIYIDNGEKISQPPMSQLSAFRSVLTRMQTPKDKNIALNWLDYLKNTENRKEKWSDSNLQLIKELLNQSHRVWELLDLPFDEITITEQMEANKLKSELWAETINLLVDACFRAHKRDCEPQM